MFCWPEVQFEDITWSNVPIVLYDFLKIFCCNLGCLKCQLHSGEENQCFWLRFIQQSWLYPYTSWRGILCDTAAAENQTFHTLIFYAIFGALKIVAPTKITFRNETTYTYAISSAKNSLISLSWMFFTTMAQKAHSPVIFFNNPVKC